MRTLGENVTEAWTRYRFERDPTSWWLDSTAHALESRTIRNAHEQKRATGVSSATVKPRSDGSPGLDVQSRSRLGTARTRWMDLELELLSRKHVLRHSTTTRDSKDNHQGSSIV
jgi:hypothetical protein